MQVSPKLGKHGRNERTQLTFLGWRIAGNGFRLLEATRWIRVIAVAYSGKAVANEFLARASAEGEELTNMKLQKLLYFAHGWYLATYSNKPLLRDVVEAWKFGPVVADVYHEFKAFGNEPIRRKARRFDGEKWIAPRVAATDTRTLRFIDKIWANYKRFSGIQLSNMTHLEGTPWYKAWYEQGGKDRNNKDIDDKDIAAYFAARLDQAR